NAFSTLILGRVSTGYPFFRTSKGDNCPSSKSLENVGLLGRGEGGILIGLAASPPANTPSQDLIHSIGLGCAFPSIFLPGFLLGTSKVDNAPVPRSWKNVALLGGVKGALSIALAASLPANTPARDLITSMVLGVAFLSIIIQGFLLSNYTARRFPRRPSGGLQ